MCLFVKVLQITRIKFSLTGKYIHSLLYCQLNVDLFKKYEALWFRICFFKFSYLQPRLENFKVRRGVKNFKMHEVQYSEFCQIYISKKSFLATRQSCYVTWKLYIAIVSLSPKKCLHDGYKQLWYFWRWKTIECCSNTIGTSCSSTSSIITQTKLGDIRFSCCLAWGVLQSRVG